MSSCHYKGRVDPSLDLLLDEPETDQASPGYRGRLLQESVSKRSDRQLSAKAIEAFNRVKSTAHPSLGEGSIPSFFISLWSLLKASIASSIADVKLSENIGSSDSVSTACFPAM